MCAFSEGVLAAEMQTFAAEVARDFPREQPALGAALTSGVLPEWLASAHTNMLGRVAVPPTCSAFHRRPFFRLARHRRCFYFQGADDDSGVVAIKGSEPAATDLDRWLAELMSALMADGHPSTQRRVGEHFALYERKIPSALSLHEATREAEAAAAVQADHLAAYGTPAHLPFPLAIHRMPRDIADRFEARLFPLLSGRARATIEPQLKEGLAVYTYYYPNPPVRVAHVSERLAAGDIHERLANLEQYAPVEIIDSWAELFVRLMLLGRLPAALGSRGTGDLCNPDNSVMDGGFVDLDSLISISELDSATDFQETLHYSFRSMCATVRALLVEPHRRDERESDLVDAWISRAVATALRRHIENETQAGRIIDERISRYFDTRLDIESLIDGLRSYFPLTPGAGK